MIRPDRPVLGLPGRRRGLAGVAVAALLGAAFVPTATGADQPDSQLGDHQVAPSATKIRDNQISGAVAAPSAYFVEFTGKSVAQGGTKSGVQADRKAFLSDAASADVELDVRAEFGTLWNGVSISADKADLAALAQSPTVKAIYPVYRIDAPERPDVNPSDVSQLVMTGADKAQNELGLKGDGIRIGIIDTGIDFDHPSFGGSGTAGTTTFPTAKVAFGYDFVGDSYNSNPLSPDYQPVPHPDAIPDDCQGHGTHVAGIAAADGEILGVAPHATLGAYRVFGCDGSTEADVMLQAMEKSYDDGMDVVNMSIGSAFSSWEEYPTAVAASSLADEGVVVVASIGNEGEDGLHAAGAPGVGENVIGVASYDNTKIKTASFVVNPGEQSVGYFTAEGAPNPPTSGTEPLARLGAPGTTEAQGCTPITQDIADQVVLIQRGTCSFYEKAVNAQNAGASGVVLYNNTAGIINPTVAGEIPITIPFVSISQADGVAMDAKIAAGGATITWTDELTEVDNPTGGLISDFSSFGLTADLSFKPDVGAPGGYIYSTYPLEEGGYATLSGTSMASPHVAGAAALLLEAKPGMTPREVRYAMQNSANPSMWAGNPGLGYLEPTNHQGAGLLDIYDTILATTAVSPGKIELGQADSGPVDVTLQLTNSGDAAKTYTLGHQPALATAGTSNDYGITDQFAEMDGPATVTVPAGGSIPVTVTITAPGDDAAEFGGYVTFTAGDEITRVPYAGYNADLQDVQFSTGIDGAELPALAQNTGCEIPFGHECIQGGSYNINGDFTYTMAGLDVPNILFHFEHQPRNMTWTAYHANADGTKGLPVAEGDLADVKDVDYLSRTQGLDAFEAWVWDGTHPDADGGSSRVASGDYVLEVTITKAQAFNDDGTAGTESYTSPAFEIAWGGDPVQPVVKRLAGYDRYSTAAAVSNEYEPGVDAVYIATGLTYPDALAAAAAAGAGDVPVLLTRTAGLPGPTRLALGRLKPDEIIVLGGPESITERVVVDLRGYTDGAVTRIAGKDRYGTAAMLSQTWDSADTVYVATGANFPDALAGAAAAGAEDAPILLTRGTSLPSATQAELDRLDPKHVVVLGGPSSISDAVLRQIDAHSGTVERIAGSDRYETAAMLAQEYTQGVPTAYLAAGTNFPDALTGAARAASTEGPMLLTRPTAMPPVTQAAIEELQPERIYILGGMKSVSEAIQDELAAMVWSQ